MRGTPGRALADDSTVLYYEVDEVDEVGGAGGTDGAGGVDGARGVDRFGGVGEVDRTRETGGTHGTGGAHEASGTHETGGAHEASGARRTSGTGGTGGTGGASDPDLEARRRRLFGDRPAPPLTVVFSHGYCLNQDSWHFQRAALRGLVRTVHWDQRGHGRSGQGVSQGGPDGVPVTMDRLGRDLKTVLDAAAPEGPLVLVGHSMGGMTVMALAERYPEFFRERVAGVAFVGTSAGNLGEVSYGLPVAGVNAVRRVLPGVLRALGTQPELVERGRRATADLFAGLVRKYSFASKDVDPAVARFAERMLEATPIDVVAAFYPAFTEHDKAAALAILDGLPVLALAGDHDLVTPGSHTEAIAALLPDAELVIVPDGGHLVMLEHPEAVTDRLAELLVRAGALPVGD
nr:MULTISPECIES: alpha/beta hydrolase [unclassified Streptomyces]